MAHRSDGAAPAGTRGGHDNLYAVTPGALARLTQDAEGSYRPRWHYGIASGTQPRHPGHPGSGT